MLKHTGDPCLPSCWSLGFHDLTEADLVFCRQLPGLWEHCLHPSVTFSVSTVSVSQGAEWECLHLVFLFVLLL